MTAYTEEHILNIIAAPCECHPYCEPACPRCVRMEQLCNSQLDVLLKLYEEGKIQLSQIDDINYPKFEIKK
jgi:hypothetical protein